MIQPGKVSAKQEKRRPLRLSPGMINDERLQLRELSRILERARELCHSMKELADGRTFLNQSHQLSHLLDEAEARIRQFKK